MWWTADPHTRVQIPLRPLNLGGDPAVETKLIRRQFILFFIFCILVIPSSSIVFSEETPSTIFINEIMYHPIQSDAYNEWIELYNPTPNPINLNGWTIEDEDEQDILGPDTNHGNGSTILSAHGYALITDHGTQVYNNFIVPSETLKLYVDDSTICGYGLNNEQEKIILKTTEGTIVYMVEWGENYDDVPGLPAQTVNQGNSLSRYPDMDTNNSLLDFTYGIIPTIGAQNNVDLDFEFYPQFLPKIYDHDDYSTTFSVKITIKNVTAQNQYHLKTYDLGDLNTSNPATQTWSDIAWKYSDNYSTTIITDGLGCWSDWQHLRFSKDYEQYKNHIQNQSTAYLKFKIKQSNLTYEIIKRISLLDMDRSTTGGTPGGCAIGRAEKNDRYLENKPLIIKNSDGSIIGISTTENNQRDEGYISLPGYYKVSCPTGSEYTLNTYETNGTLSLLLPNLEVRQGCYKVHFEQTQTQYAIRKNQTLTIPLFIKNSGDLSDTFDIAINQTTPKWDTTLDQPMVTLSTEELALVNIHITPNQQSQNTTITVSATSQHDPGVTNHIILSIKLLGPDLIVKNITCYDTFDHKTTIFGEGENIRIKTQIKNQGNENTTNVTINFYYDIKDEAHLIGQKFYETITKYNKYPSVDWDTKNMLPGSHSIFVVVDPENTIEETQESNNENQTTIQLNTTIPDGAYTSLSITEVYYRTHPHYHNEFITLYNPTTTTMNISNWYLTTDPWKNPEDQTKILFPEGTEIKPNETITITQNAQKYITETGKKPDYEYENNSLGTIPDMTKDGTITLSNTGEIVALKDRYNHTIDLIAYGDISHQTTEGWEGPPCISSGDGVILKRNIINGIPKDSNSSEDWIHPRIYGIGQSDFPTQSYTFSGMVQPFVSPDNSYETINRELRKANQSIYLNIYEFTSPFLGDELVAALKRNVSVFMFVEGGLVGGIDDREKWVLQRIVTHGGNIRFIMNKQDDGIYKRYRFDHAKYLIIDNKTVIVESCNWAKTGIPKNPSFGNREWGIIIHNIDIAAYFYQVFRDDWNPTRLDSIAFDEMHFTIPEDFFIDKNSDSGAYKPIFSSQQITGNFTITPVFSPDNSETEINRLIETATTSIYIEQLYIYKNWDEHISPFVEKLVNKSEQGVDIKVILNYNPSYDSTNDELNETKNFLEENGIKVKLLYTNWSYFENVHNKGMIVDNTTTLISSINWNQNSVTENREAGVIIENKDVAITYAAVFLYDWSLQQPEQKPPSVDYKNLILIALIIIFTIIFIALDWRKRKWT
jgi:cardiolipin synthase A/B